MNAIELLTQQHDDVDELIGKIEGASSAKTKEALFIELSDLLAAHAKIEETIFYPAVMAKQTEDLLLESVEEHCHHRPRRAPIPPRSPGTRGPPRSRSGGASAASG